MISISIKIKPTKLASIKKNFTNFCLIVGIKILIKSILET